jgi:phosphatidylserine decarboxylase
MVRNLTTSGDPNVGPFAPRSLTRFFAREHRPPYRPNCHIVSPVDGVGLPSVPILNSVFSVSMW